MWVMVLGICLQWLGYILLLYKYSLEWRDTLLNIMNNYVHAQYIGPVYVATYQTVESML